MYNYEILILRLSLFFTKKVLEWVWIMTISLSSLTKLGNLTSIRKANKVNYIIEIILVQKNN